MAADEFLVTVRALLPTPTGSGIFLTDGEKTIAIFVDVGMGRAISMFMEGVERPRPLTHDLIGDVFRGFGVRLAKVVICDMQEGTFFARLHLRQESELGTSFVEVDSRPSDAVALAVQADAPIFVVAAVWEGAEDMGWALDAPEGGDDGFVA